MRRAKCHEWAVTLRKRSAWQGHLEFLAGLIEASWGVLRVGYGLGSFLGKALLLICIITVLKARPLGIFSGPIGAGFLMPI